MAVVQDGGLGYCTGRGPASDSAASEAIAVALRWYLRRAARSLPVRFGQFNACSSSIPADGPHASMRQERPEQPARGRRGGSLERGVRTGSRGRRVQADAHRAAPGQGRTMDRSAAMSDLAWTAVACGWCGAATFPPPRTRDSRKTQYHGHPLGALMYESGRAHPGHGTLDQQPWARKASNTNDRGFV